MAHKKTVSLALGSGAARGMAHIGVIEVLEEHGYEIKSIAGSSIGALVGGVYARGKLDVFKKWVLSVKEHHVFKYLEFSFGAQGLFDADKIISFLRDLVGDAPIETLPIRYTAVASDVDHEREVWLNSGSLFDAIRASISIPAVFEPAIHNQRTLVDGGVLNPVPIAPMMSDVNDLIVAVNINSNAPLVPGNPSRTADEETPTNPFFKRLAEKLATKPKSKKLNLLDIFGKSIDTMQNTISILKLAAYPPDITINVPRDICALHEFHKAADVIEQGRQLTEIQLERYQG
ncbi:MAG: serine protease [Gemmatimonadetes bacterium]|nr:MAG: serine protease [Gemmatimonadota bacterium]